MDIFKKVVEIVADKLDIDAKEITPETTFEDLGADSLDIVELVMALEEEFDLEISDDDADKISSIGDAVATLKRIYNLNIWGGFSLPKRGAINLQKE